METSHQPTSRGVPRPIRGLLVNLTPAHKESDALASHRRGPRDTLHLTRQNQAQTHKTVAPSALGSTKPADTRHRLHPTRQNPTKTNQTVAPSAVSAQKPTPPPHQLHPTRHNQAQTRKTVALGAVGARKHWRAHPPRVSPPALHVQRRSLTVEGR